MEPAGPSQAGSTAVPRAIRQVWPALPAYLYRTKAGLVIRIIGENPQAAHDIGFKVIHIRYLAVLFGGAMAGLGGACLAIAYTPLWVENMTAGRGWIALASSSSQAGGRCGCSLARCCSAA